jgi:hypothetical protein
MLIKFGMRGLSPTLRLVQLISVLKMITFWDIARCSPAVAGRRFRATMEAVRTSETSVCYNETTRRFIPEGYLSIYHLHTLRRENLQTAILVLLM